MATHTKCVCSEYPQSLDRLSTTTETANITFRVLDFLSIGRDNGNCVVLILARPGMNLLGRYFPPGKVNVLLLADVSKTRSITASGDISMTNEEDLEIEEETEQFETMDLATFLEYDLVLTVLHGC